MEMGRTKDTACLLGELEEILEASFDGIMVTDGNGNCLMANSSYTRNTGIRRDEIVGHNMRELINPVWMKRSIALDVIENGCAMSMEHDTQNGNHISVTGTPIFDEKNKVKRVVVNTRDISEINHLKLKLGEARPWKNSISRAWAFIEN